MAGAHGAKDRRGRTRIAEAQRARWAAFRACRNSEGPLPVRPGSLFQVDNDHWPVTAT
jgi:hypothetical protein